MSFLIVIYFLVNSVGYGNSLPLFSHRETTSVEKNTEDFVADSQIGNLSFYEIDDMMFLTTDRSGQSNSAYRWPKGRIPFTFAPGYSYFEMRDIRLAMYYIEEFTCIRFYNRQNSDKNYLYIRRAIGKCSSFVGNIRQGPQQVSLDPGTRRCNRPNFPGHVLHELTHAIGFFHEHARDDRGSYVDIRYTNLPSDDRTRKNYNRNIDNRIESKNFGVPYNYGSIMHYSGRAGSINGKETIVRKAKIAKGLPQPLEGTMGQREKLSYGDIRMIQSMYANECSGLVDLDDIPDTEDIPELEEWMEERQHTGAEMPEMQVENVSEESVGIINEIPEDNQTPDFDPDYSTYTDDPPVTFPSSVNTTDKAQMNATIPTNTAEPNKPIVNTTKRPTLPTTTRKTRKTTRRIVVHSTTPVVTKVPNLFNLIQYVIHQFQSQSG